jgi:prepilin-type N-terminal cleavage/methylation domain-containing protein
MKGRSAFTLIEVLAALIVLSLGLASAIGLVMYGMQLSRVSISRATGLATALTVAVDPQPLYRGTDPWITANGVRKGWVNGYWVEREEVDRRVITPGVESCAVHVDVYDTNLGQCVASYTERVVKQAP